MKEKKEGSKEEYILATSNLTYMKLIQI